MLHKESQEGFLARHSNLAIDTDYHKISSRAYPVSEKRKHIALKAKLTHYIPYFGTVFSKGVTFIVEPDDVANPKNFDQFNIISASAPDMRPGSDESIFFKNHASKNKDAQSNQYEVVKNKIQAIFNTAIIEGNRHIVLGAFGCGIFENETEIVAQIFKKVINQPRYKDRFETFTLPSTARKNKIFSKKSSKTKCIALKIQNSYTATIIGIFFEFSFRKEFNEQLYDSCLFFLFFNSPFYWLILLS